MEKTGKPGLLLGRQTPVVQEYAPQLLYPIARSEGRAALLAGAELPFAGVDLWHAYELSWLAESGRPVVRVGRFFIPADSPNMVESKSFKLYLNSLNGVCFGNDTQARDRIVADISAVTGSQVRLELHLPDDPVLAGTALPGTCIDEQPLQGGADVPAPDLLELQAGSGERQYYSHLLRSLCPVTGQPDWASLHIHSRGPLLVPSSLLAYIIAFRQHQEFHEQCVERIFVDILERCKPEFLQVQAFYTRRGGLDINPMRSTRQGAQPLPRLDRQ
jgi:7-cyano-7-deazaguanine reductase